MLFCRLRFNTLNHAINGLSLRGQTAQTKQLKRGALKYVFLIVYIFHRLCHVDKSPYILA